MLKIRWYRDRLIFNMGIPIPEKDSLYIEMGPRSWPTFQWWSLWYSTLQPGWACTRKPAKLKTLLAEVSSEHARPLHPPAPPETTFFVMTIMLSWDLRFFHRAGCATCCPNLAKLWPPRQCSLLTTAMCSTVDTKKLSGYYSMSTHQWAMHIT